MPKIAIIGSRGIPAKYGGFETFAEEVSIGLTEAGYDVTVFCEDSKGTANLTSYKGVRLEYVSTKFKGVISTILLDMKAFWRAGRSCNVVYMLGYGASIFAWVPRLFGATVWINMDGLEWSRKKWSYFPARQWFIFNERLATWFANLLIADASAIKAYLTAKYRQLPSVKVIEYGARVRRSKDMLPDVIRSMNLRERSYDLVVCRLEPENHVLEIIEAYKNMLDRTLVVIGETAYGGAYIDRLLENRTENIMFVGSVYEPEKLDTIRFFSRIYLHGHSVGGTNPSLLEAMAMRNIVVAHDNVFNREVLGSCGLYFEGADDIVSVVKAFDKMSDEKLDRLRNAAYERVTEKYNWPRIIAEYRGLLEAS